MLQMAEARSATEFCHAHYVDAFIPESRADERLKNLKSILAKGQVVVLKGAKTHKRINLNYEELRDCLDLTNGQNLDVHGLHR